MTTETLILYIEIFALFAVICGALFGIMALTMKQKPNESRLAADLAGARKWSEGKSLPNRADSKDRAKFQTPEYLEVETYTQYIVTGNGE